MHNYKLLHLPVTTFVNAMPPWKMDCHVFCFVLKKKEGKGSFYIAQYPVRWTAQSALHFLPPLADLFIPTPTRLLPKAFHLFSYGL